MGPQTLGRAVLDLTGCKKFENDARLKHRLLFLEQEWHRAYPRVDLQKQLGWAHAWLISSNKRYTDMTRFLNNWFKRCQMELEKIEVLQGPIVMPKPTFKEEKPNENDVMTEDDFKKMREAIRETKRSTTETV